MDTAILTPALFDSLKSGQHVRVLLTGSISSDTLDLRVGRRSHSKKFGGIDSITLNYTDGRPVHPTANRIQLHKYADSDHISISIGDMGVSAKSFEVVP